MPRKISKRKQTQAARRKAAAWEALTPRQRREVRARQEREARKIQDFVGQYSGGDSRLFRGPDPGPAFYTDMLDIAATAAAMIRMELAGMESRSDRPMKDVTPVVNMLTSIPNGKDAIYTAIEPRKLRVPKETE